MARKALCLALPAAGREAEMGVDGFDIAVIGGGPAGAVAALLAAREGARVVLVDPDRTTARLEGIGERLMKWLHAQGLAERLPDVTGRVPRRASWGGTVTDANGEHLVERAAMDRALRAAAEEAGATVVTGTATPRAGRDGVSISLSDGRTVSAARAIDARGRAAHAGRPVRRGPATIAVGGWLAEPPGAAPGAQVAPVAEGWVWLARPGDGRVWVQATLDARGSEAPPAQRLATALAAAAPDLPDLPAGAARGLSIRECAPVIAETAIDPRLLPAGDAAAGMDPLSGHGMFWAVSGALAALAALRTLEARPGPETEALVNRYLGGRIRETYLRQARLGRDFLRQEPRYAEHPFWTRRLGFPDDASIHAGESAARAETAVVVEDGLLVERTVLVTPQEPAGVAWVAGVPVAEVWAKLRDGATAEALAEAYGPERARACLGWLAARGLS